ncbi:hypothetical protein BCEN4_270009 [Burkholderia cenocepacia]|nr:hypothetical protein BCEN4_270009 [Burkholderia cenocepacia]
MSIFDFLILALAYLAQTMTPLLRRLLTKRQQDRELDWILCSMILTRDNFAPEFLVALCSTR